MNLQVGFVTRVANLVCVRKQSCWPSGGWRMARSEKDGSQGDKHDGEREQEMPGEAPQR